MCTCEKPDVLEEWFGEIGIAYYLCCDTTQKITRKL